MSPHRAVLVELVQRHHWTQGAELGVDKGVLFNMLLTSCLDLNLIGVDTFPVEKRKAHVYGIQADFPARARLYEMTTHEASALVADHSLDFVFIDADHGEPAVADDIACWQSKVRQGGWLGGHDYNQHFPGVRVAVDRAFGKRVKQWPGSIWGVWQ